MAMRRTPERWDLFCRVVDNFGDAGVCWRLARQLARTASVRLWIDDIACLQPLDPRIECAASQSVGGVEIAHWKGDVPETPPGDVVIEAFGCGLPAGYVDVMAQTVPRPLWIVLEYLSAESWIPHHHGLPSPHPRLPVERYFFFPGFVAGTGGLLREADLFARREGFGAAGRLGFWRALGHEPPPEDATTVSLFAYGHAPLQAFLSAWASGTKRVVLAVPQTPIVEAICDYFEKPVPGRPGEVFRRDALEVRLLPFVPQVRYDELLWSCDVNFVRGEDSFVRAQWAARPFVWHAYPQTEGAHWRKIDAFADLYAGGLTAEARAAVTTLMRTWNRDPDVNVPAPDVWAAFLAHEEEIYAHGRSFAAAIAAVGELSDNLAAFCADKLK